MRRILTHREQAQMLEPWRVADVSVRPDALPPGMSGAGSTAVLPPHIKDPEPTGDWVNADWRNAQDYGAFLSSSRPPMSSDLPHPAKLLDPNDKRRAKVLARAAASRDPDNDPYGVLTGTGLTFGDLVRNHIGHHNGMDDDQRFRGRVWYQAAHDATKDLAQKTRGDHPRTVAIMSAYSPVKDWDQNMEQGFHFLTHYDGSDPHFRMPAAPENQTAKARAIYHAPGGTDFLSVLGGPKTSSFFHNILDPTSLRTSRQGIDDDDGFYHLPTNPYTGEPDWRLHPDQDVTADTHHARLQVTPAGADLTGTEYKVPPHFDYKFTKDGKTYHPGYDLHARASAEATRLLNLAEPDPYRHLIPKQTQAGPWGKFKADLIRAGVSPRMPEPGAEPNSMSELSDPIPRYQRDRGPGWWNDPRRPEIDLRQAPNWSRRGAVDSGQSMWDSVLDSWITQNYPGRSRNTIAAALRIVAEADAVLGRLT